MYNLYFIIQQDVSESLEIRRKQSEVKIWEIHPQTAA